MNRGLVWIVAAAGIIGFFASAWASDEKVPCDVQAGACKGALSGQAIQLEIIPRPVSAMTDLTFRVTLSGQRLPEGQNPYIDLGMPGMTMGPNRVNLKPTSSAAYEGKGIIVRCPSGKRTWAAAVTVPGQGVITFVFDVLY